MSAKPAEGVKPIANNRKARHFYEILEILEAGMALTGSEVKSLRSGKANFKDGYVRFTQHEAFLCGVHIAPYENAGYAQHDPERERKLLLHEHEIKTLKAKVEQKGLTVVPLRLYFKSGRVKLEIGLARGKNVHDRKNALKEKDLDREAQRKKIGTSNHTDSSLIFFPNTPAALSSVFTVTALFFWPSKRFSVNRAVPAATFCRAARRQS